MPTRMVKTLAKTIIQTQAFVARLAGYPNHSRLVGRILGGASEAHGVPCHRVVNCQSRTAPSWSEQRVLLEAEGVKFKTNNHVDLKVCLWNIMEIDSFNFDTEH